MYNITMTSLPILWFAVYDFEYEKDKDENDDRNVVNTKYFLLNAELYKIGMNGTCFSLPILGQWILYAIFHAAMIYFMNFVVLT